MEQITQEKALELASTLLKLDASELKYEPLESGDGFYVWQPTRGGGALVIANDSSVLFANSSVTTDEHFKAFYEGKRTDINQFP